MGEGWEAYVIRLKNTTLQYLAIYQSQTEFTLFN